MTTRIAVIMTWLALGCAATRDEAQSPRLRPVVLPAEALTDSVGPSFPSLDGSCRALAFASAGQVYVHALGTRSFELVSVTASGGPANRPSGVPALSSDAARVAFDSVARLVPGPMNRHDQIFVRDRVAGSTLLASRSSAGELANDANLALNTGLSLAANGTLVAFSSYATNLVEGDRNGSVDVFVRDLVAGTTERVSITSRGEEVHGESAYPSLSGDGSLVVFSSSAPDLVAGDANGARDVFVHDRRALTTERISVAAGGGEANGASDLPKLSADGRFVVFASDASNLVEGDTNGARDVFLHDRRLGTLRSASTRAGEQASGPSDYPEISADGSRIAFASRAPGASDTQQVILRDFRADRRWTVSAAADGRAGDDDSGDWGLALSGDGRCVAFTSFASNLGAPGPSLFVAEVP